MASGVFRPYSAVDVLGSLMDGISALAPSSTGTGTGHFAEADETVGFADSATVTAQASLPWGEGQWSLLTWG